MNKRVVLILITALATLAPFSAYASVRLAEPDTTALSNGLIGYWSFDGNSTTFSPVTTGTSTDLSGSGNTGFLHGGETAAGNAVPGKIGQALKLTGNPQYVDIPTLYNNMTYAGFSVSGWFYESGNPAYNSRIITNSHTDSDNDGFQIWIASGGDGYCVNTGTNTLRFDIGNGSSNACANSGINLSPNTWYFYTGTYNGSTVSIYLNGTLAATSSFSGSMGASPNDLNIGRDPAYNGDYFTGLTDDVRIYNRALSSQEVALLYALGTIHTGNTQAVNSSFSIDQGGLNGGLVAYWPFDGNTTNWATGSTNDVSGNGNTGSLIGMSTSSSPVAGKIGQALKFNGSTAYIATAYTIPAQSSATSFTWSTWAYVNPGNTGTVVMLGFRNGATWVKLTPTAFEYSAGSIMSYSVPTGQWLFLTVVKNGTNFTYYQNGTVVATASNSGSVVAHQFYIGGDPGFPGDGVFSGMLDDVRVYNRALTSQEVADLYTAGKVNIDHSNTISASGINSGLVGYWTFDGPSINWRTNTIADMSGNGGTGTMISFSTSTSPVAGKIGQALKFNGSTSYITVPDSTALNITGSITMSAWIYPTTVGIDQKIFGKQNSSNGYKFGLYSDNHVEMELDSGGTAYNIRGTSGGVALTTGKWYFVACTYSTATGYITCYVNGAFDRRAFEGSSVLGSSSGVVLEIGTSVKDNQGGIFHGDLDDVRVYNRALSAQEIQELYQMAR